MTQKIEGLPTGMDPVTGLPALPPNEWWCVWEDPNHFIYCYTYISRMRKSRRWPFRKTTEMSREEILSYKLYGSAPRPELTPADIVKGAEALIKRRDANIRKQTMLGTYPPNTLL